MPFVLPVPPTPPPPIAVGPAWEGFRVVWTGFDGSEWDLTGRNSPVRLIDEAPTRGFGRPQFTRFTQKSANVAGSRARGYNTEEREVMLPLLVYTDMGTAEWLAVDAAFQRTIHPARVGTLALTSPSGQTRTLRCSFSDEDDSLSRDPAHAGWQIVAPRMIAGQPFWRGVKVVRSFKQAEDVEFFSNDGDDYVVQISPGQTLDSAAISNPGDEDSYLKYIVHGPTVTATVRGNEFPFVIDAGKAVILDTSPEGREAREALVSLDDQDQYVYTFTGVDRSKDLGAVNFSPIAPGAEVTLAMSMTGPGRVMVELWPEHHRAWN